MIIFSFIKDVLSAATKGGRLFHIWMAFLSLFVMMAAYCYFFQIRDGLITTGMNDHTSWGLYISNFTFLVGMAAAAVMLVMPTYVLHDVDFSKAVLIGEGLAVSALMMALCFVTADMGGPQRLWHMMPFVGIFNFPESMLTWDVIVLNGYLAINLTIPAYILFSHWQGKHPNKKFYVPMMYCSVFWAVGIHMVTAFLYAGLPARPYWNNALLGPRFLASAFSGGPAFIIIALAIIGKSTAYKIKDNTIQKIAMIVTVAAQINLIMLGSEIFKEFYAETHHSISAKYLFFGLHDHVTGEHYNSLVPWIWTGITLNVIATVTLTFHPLRRNKLFLYPACLLLFVGIWIEKGMGLIVPGFIPSPLGEIVEYQPSWGEILITAGIWAFGMMIFTCLVKAAVGIELGKYRCKTIEVDHH